MTRFVCTHFLIKLNIFLRSLKNFNLFSLVHRGVVDDSGEQFVAYFLPTEDTMKKRKRDSENGVEYDDEDK